MKHPNIHLILATGGGALVKAAYSSGKPAYGVGPGMYQLTLKNRLIFKICTSIGAK